jgi:hypothetical protein
VTRDIHIIIIIIMIIIIIQPVTENIDNLDLRKGRHVRNVWEMQT